MSKHSLHVSLDVYNEFQELKNLVSEITENQELTDEAVIQFMVREITESIKMMQKHSHEGGCCGGGHCHEEEGEKNDGCCGGHDCCKHE